MADGSVIIEIVGDDSKLTATMSKLGSKTQKAAQELSENILKAASKWVSDKKHYNDLAAQNELEFWQEVKNLAGLKAAELAEIDKKIYSARVNMSKEAFEHSKNWIEQEKFYNRLSAEEEVAAWERVVERKNLLSEQQLIAERNLYTAQQNLLKEQEKAIEEHARAVEARINTLSGFAGLFDNVTAKADVSGRELLENLRGQVETFKNWQADIESLAERGVLSDTLLGELTDMGPKVAAELHALTKLTDEQLMEYSALEQELSRLIAEQAEKDVPSIKLAAEVDTEAALAAGMELVSAVAEGAAAAVEVIQSAAQGTALAYVAAALMRRPDFSFTAQSLMEGFNEGLRIKGNEAINIARWTANAIIMEMQRALDINSPSRKMRDLVGKPAAEGFLLGFENEIGRFDDFLLGFENEIAWFNSSAQAAVGQESALTSAHIAASSESARAAREVTRETFTNTNNTIEKIAYIEGDGITDELIRMLGLRIKAEDRRRGRSLAE